MTDFAKRAYDHSYRIDPIVRSLLDTDVYKLLMGQFIWMYYRLVPVTFKVINRSKTIRLGNLISFDELKAQLDHVRSLRFTPNELIWLAGNTFYGKKGIFMPEYIEFLRNLKLPDYHLEMVDGEIALSFSGDWASVTFWEIYSMIIVNTMRNRAKMKGMSRFDLRRLYNEAEHRLFTDLDVLAKNKIVGMSDFGTRRRHDFLWQKFCVEACVEILGADFAGTSNSLLAMTLGIENRGTNGHEMPMVVATLADTDEELQNSQYSVLEQWQTLYDGNLLVMLPDTFGTTQFLKNAPDWVADWTGIRLDSKDPFVAGDEAIEFFRSRGRDPMDKLILPSDGLDVNRIVQLRDYFKGKVGRIGYGFGTNLTNNFPDPVKPISLVCKVSHANGKSAVKLSDNKNKRTGSPEQIERYVRVFGEEGIDVSETKV